MRYAIVRSDNTIVQIMPKLSPSTRIEATERICSVYFDKELDDELESPILASVTDTEVYFTAMFDPMMVTKFIDTQVSKHLDAQAQSFGYTNLVSAISYINSSNTKYAQEANALLTLRDTCWEFIEIAPVFSSASEVRAYISMLPGVQL